MAILRCSCAALGLRTLLHKGEMLIFPEETPTIESLPLGAWFAAIKAGSNPRQTSGMSSSWT
eukprot:5942621-Amphidinium_carterae.1